MTIYGSERKKEESQITSDMVGGNIDERISKGMNQDIEYVTEKYGFTLCKLGYTMEKTKELKRVKDKYEEWNKTKHR